jgi:hypothetical protein
MTLTLLTKDGRRCGNGIITGGEDTEHGYVYEIQTDYGNRMRLTIGELDEMYHIGRVIHYEEWDGQRRALRDEIVHENFEKFNGSVADVLSR